MLKAESGFSLLETLIAMATGLVVLATVLSLFISLLGTANTTLQLSRLNQEVHSISDVLSRDIQRAGFHPAAVTETALNQVGPSAIAKHLVFSPSEDLYPSANAAHCIRVKFWDADAPSGQQAVVRIYHFQASTGVLRVHRHVDVQSVEPLNILCGSGSQLTSSKEIRVQQLSLRLTPNSHAQGARSIELVMSAAYVKRPDLAQTLHRRVLLRNQGGG
ncbi:type IV pilin [Oceanisphaera sp. IT1-181]|uniref:type IV pilin n=1 Tax=Oceanisphaera sp. IT1-181 TaxID=3081199 RepID=UPI0029CA3266|nr:type IV pilin [Oceanisphaera sp. IT1-181]